MRLDRLLTQAGDLGVAVEWHALGARRGDYSDDLGVIRINPRLTRVQQIETLAHELGHAIHGDRVTTAAVERRASVTGAGLVLSVDEYRQAETVVGNHVGALAVELGVTARLVRDWRRWFRRQAAASDRMNQEVRHGMD